MDNRLKMGLTCLLLAISFHSHAEGTPDPYERYNRAMFKFNDKADQYVFTPVARGYRKVTPKPVRTAVGNFFNNLRDVKSMGNNILRGHIGKAGGDFMRVAVNTTFGIGGLIDIASAANMPNHKTTFGDTLASWGWKNSNYFVMPLFGSSTVRDTVGEGVSMAYSPQGAIIHDRTANYSLTGLNAGDGREKLLDTTDTLNEMALDKYVAMRDAYMALRNKQLGNAAAIQPEDGLTDPEAASAPASGEPKIALPVAQRQPENPTTPAQE
ncbi:MlaA family lipoprotein [Kingella oralis]|uniref:MlaA family lipoprotein n=1 Tax=Kingella oralis TaxID=505 RepID=UPI0034E474C4